MTATAAGDGNTPIMHIIDSADTEVAWFEGNRAGDTGAFIAVRHNPSSQANSNRSGIRFQADDDAGNVTNYARITQYISDSSNGTEDGYLGFNLMKDGSDTETMRLSSNKLLLGQGNFADPTLEIDSASGGDPKLVFDTGAANRSAVINFLDEGTNIGGITYSHNGDSLGFRTGSASANRFEVREGYIKQMSGGASGQSHYMFNNGQVTVADDALIDIDGVINTAALVIVQCRYDGASIKYVSGLFFVDYPSGNAPVLLADPDSAFHNGDVDGKNCLFMNGNANIRFKNRSGVSNPTAIHIIQFQGN